MQILKVYRRLVSRMSGPLPQTCRLPKGYHLDVTYSGSRCRQCGEGLNIGWTAKRSPIGIKIGQPQVHQYIKVCTRCKEIHNCEDMEALVPAGSQYCYDIIMTVGQWHWLEDMRVVVIQERLKEYYGLDVPLSTIIELSHKFLDYLLSFHQSKDQQIGDLLKRNGGYICHCDGTCEAGTSTIFVAIDGITGIVLKSEKMRAETTEYIQNMLVSCDQTYGKPLALLSDLSAQISQAIENVWPDTRAFVCHYHLLCRIGEKLFDKLHRRLTKRLRVCKISSSLRQMRKDLLRSNKKQPPINIQQKIKYLIDKCGTEQIGDIQPIHRSIAYTFLLWIRDYSTDMEGKNYPFDLPSLAFYNRCEQMHDKLDKMFKDARFAPERVQTLGTALKHLSPVKTDDEMVKVAGALKTVKRLYDRLRAILRLDSSKGPGQRSWVHTDSPQQSEKMLKELKAYRQKLRKIVDSRCNTERREAASIILEYLDRYWTKIIGHTIKVATSEDEKFIQVSRTNNIAEKHFGDQKRHLRRQMGVANLKRAMEAARPERMLLSNLEKKDYVELLLDGSVSNLEHHFVSCDKEARQIRKQRKIREIEKPIPITVQDIRDKDFVAAMTEAAGLFIANMADIKRAA